MKAKTAWITLVLLLVAGLTFFSLPSCDKVKQATQFKVKYKLPDRYFSVDSLSHLKTEQVLFTQSYSANLDSIVGANSGLLGAVSFYQLRLNVVSPDWVTLGWINSARITVTPANGAPVEVATTQAISPSSRSIDFVVKNLDLASNINGPFVLNVYGDLSGPIPSGSIQMLLESGIQVTINPL